MFSVSTRGVGMNGGLPDVCETPALVPTPFYNIALHAMALDFVLNVLVAGMNALNEGSFIPTSMGMEPGVLGPFYKLLATFTLGNPVVNFGGLPVICQLCLARSNFVNVELAMVIVPSIPPVVFIMGYAGGAPSQPAGGKLPSQPAGGKLAPRALAGDPYARDLGPEEIDALLRDLASVGREAGPPVTARMRAPGVGEVAIGVFSADVPARVLGAVRALEAEGMRELVIDLRDNPGGEVNAFIELAGDFLPPGSEVVTVIDEDGDETVRRSWQERPYPFPVTLLVNRATASAAEMFAGCLAAHGRAVIEGGETFGKRVGQAVVVGPQGEARAETRLRYRLPVSA